MKRRSGISAARDKFNGFDTVHRAGTVCIRYAPAGVTLQIYVAAGEEWKAGISFRRCLVSSFCFHGSFAPFSFGDRK